MTLAALAPPALAETPGFLPPRVSREQMEAALGTHARWRFVYGTRDPSATEALRDRALLVARRLFRGDSSWVVPDTAMDARTFASASVMLVGSPRENTWTARVAEALPVRFGDGRFAWQGTAYTRPDEAITLVRPNPLAPERFLIVTAGNSPAALARRGGFLFGEDDWRITRAGDLVRSGRFAQAGGAPWRYDPALDADRDAERERFLRSLVRTSAPGLEVRAEPASESRALRAQAAALLAECDRIGLPAPSGAAPVTLTLYRSLEHKGEVTRDTRPEHSEGGAAHVAAVAGAERSDLWSVAEARLRQRGAGESRFLRPAAVWLAGRAEGEPLAVAVARLAGAGLLPSAAEAASRDGVWRSPLRWVPARAILARAVWECAPAASRREALLALIRREPPGTLDSLCAAAGAGAPAVAERYAAITAALAARGAAGLASGGPKRWTPADRFQRGVCLAHGVRLQEGYLSAAAARELRGLRERGAAWVSLTPFGYLRSRSSPEIASSADGGPDMETDESLVECTARARQLGLRVWLKPHLWTRGWVGDLEFAPGDWVRFFHAYREFMLHWAILADRERIDGLFVGHELASSTREHPERWRALIAEVRRLYRGTLSYGANWDEVVHVGFWDALDLVSVSFYAPISAAPTREPRLLGDGVRKALAPLREVSRRTGRPVLIAEAGYAAMAAAPVRPWAEGEGPVDAETQRACYEALVSGLEDDLWIAGVFWWKWFTSPAGGGPGDGSFSPRGKPAEAVMTRALRAWQDRPVRAAGR